MHTLVVTAGFERRLTHLRMAEQEVALLDIGTHDEVYR
jgi:hypothetical protein